MSSSAATNSDAARRPPRSGLLFPDAASGDRRRRGCGRDPGDGAREPRPLALFDAVRVDYSLRRLVHYTGTDWRSIQPWILLTNYHRYVDQFIRWAAEELAKDGPFEKLVMPGGITLERGLDEAAGAAALRFALAPFPDAGLPSPAAGRALSHAREYRRRPLERQEHHRSPCRAAPHCWLMVGHCGGLRQSQTIGDYVLAHGYLRRDRILDAAVPPKSRFPPSRRSSSPCRCRARTYEEGDDEEAPAHRHGRHLRRPQLGAPLEPGAAADQSLPGHRGRHGERHRRGPGLSPARSPSTARCSASRTSRSMARSSCPAPPTRSARSGRREHLMIGLTALEILREQRAGLHSRKLRSFDEPPFR